MGQNVASRGGSESRGDPRLSEKKLCFFTFICVFRGLEMAYFLPPRLAGFCPFMHNLDLPVHTYFCANKNFFKKRYFNVF